MKDFEHPSLSNQSSGSLINNDKTEVDLIANLNKGKGKKYIRFIMAALSSLPWVGSIIGAAASFTAEKDQEKLNDLQKLWLEEHREKNGQLSTALMEIIARLDGFGDEVQSRIESEDYLKLVKKTFRSWDQADTEQKRQMYQKLITNAGAITLCPDDLIRLFINWIDIYHEAHFMVIKEIYKNQGITRAEIWEQIHGEFPQENSAEADLYKYLIRDLSTGGVIRQERDVTSDGRFLRKARRVRNPSRTMESAFEETKGYELTELGKQFVHYVMEDVVTQIGG